MTTPRELKRAGATADGGEPAATAIRAEIERTRERLGDSVEALGAQLNPSHLTQRVKDSVREATIGRVQTMASNTKERIAETGRGLAETIRENPLPAAMAAAGIGWLLLSSRDKATIRRFTRGRPDEFPARDESQEATGIRAGMRSAADNVAERAHDLTEKAQNVSNRVVEKVRETGDRAADTADAAMHRVRDRARSTARSVENQFEESPMGIGAVAIALGLAIGLSVPTTRKEGAIMGDARDKLLDKARERVADTTEKVEHVVERAIPEVQAAVREAARAEGLSG